MLDDQNTHPLSDFVQNTKIYVQRLKKTKGPELLTVNGRAELVVQDAESYQAMVDELERARFVQSLVSAEKDFDSGKSRPANEFFTEIIAKYGA